MLLSKLVLAVYFFNFFSLFLYKIIDMKTALISIVLLGIGFAGIAIKIWSKKDGKFEGTCASNNPLITKEGEPCGFCGAEPDEMCKSDS